MAGRGDDSRRLDEWGPVCRGFLVLLPDGQRGSVQDIRLRNAGIELLVETGLFVRRGLSVCARDIEAIFPSAYQIVVRASSNGAPSDDETEVEAAGGIVRMPMRDSSPVASPREAA